jgi:hypothetical protein
MNTNVFLLTALASTLVSGSRRPGSKKNTSTPPFIIDSHTHYEAADAWEKSFLEIYTRRNAMAWLMVWKDDLERGIQFAGAHPDRVIPYASVDIDSPAALDDIQKVSEMGFKGLGELFAVGQWNYDNPKYDPIWELAEKLCLPVAPHTGILAYGMMARMRPGYLGTIAAKFPKLVIHAAHFGNPWYDEAGEVTRRNKNLYFDVSGSSLIKKGDDPGYWKQFLWWTPYLGKAHMPEDAVPAFEKILFATDEPPEGLEANIIRFNRMLDACGVSADTRARCYGLTIAGIHGLKS